MRWKKWINPFADISVASPDAIREAAACGDVAAQYRLGRMYEEGRWTDRDDRSAAQWYQRAADRGHAEAQFRLGRMYHEGRGLDRDDKKAVRWLRLAVEQGHKEALRYLEGMLADPDGFPNATGPAFVAGPDGLLRRLDKQVSSLPLWIAVGLIVVFLLFGDLILQYDYGRLFRRGPAVTASKPPAPTVRDGAPRVPTARRQTPSGPPESLVKAAEKGDPAAQNRLGWMYDSGKGVVTKDSEQAVVWYRKAADQGFARAQCNLGWMYENGRGVARDYEQAAIWYRKAADQGFARAQYNLGLAYEFGRGVEKNTGSAREWHRKAAAGGYEKARQRLRRLADDARGADILRRAWEADPTIAEFRRAAEQGDAVAQYNLAVLCEGGIYGPQDYERAASLYRKGAEQGLKEAQYSLARLYEHGQGVPRDKAQALEWYRKAAEAGDEVSKAKVRELEQRPAGR